MGLLDDAMGQLGEHADEVAAGIDSVGDLVDEKTGGQYSEQVDQAQAAAKEWVAGQADN